MKFIFFAISILLSANAFGQQFSKADAGRCATRSKNVTIIRDNYGVPHIFGKTDADAVFGLLYTQCEDNFAGVERNYLYQLGRQAEADGESRLIEDLQMKLIADSTAAINEYKNSPIWFKKLMDAFADGINYYLYKHPETKPLAIKHFEPWYALMFTDGSVAATNYGDIALQESAQFYNRNTDKVGSVKSPMRREVTDIADRAEIGSNGFAIAPAKSVSGHAMLYINPHVPFYFRAEVQLVSDEGLNVYGAVTWGQFFIYQGFNQHCGWMHTSSYADVADVYKETVTPNNGKWQYLYNGALKPVIEKQFTLNYLVEGKLKQKTYKGYFTHHGPVLAARAGKWLSLKHYNRSYNALLESWLITKAKNFTEYKNAMGLLANTSNNTVYADDKGNTAFWYGNFMPKRNPAYDWKEPVDGTITATEWKGNHTLDQIVHIYNPQSGWIQNCNSTPFKSAGKSSPVKSNYPSYMAPDGENYRAVTAEKLLGSANKLDLEGLINVGYNRHLAIFDALLPPLFKAYDTLPDDSIKQSIASSIEVLKNWDRNSGVNSVATTVAVEWGSLLLRSLPKVFNTAAGTYQTERVEALLKYNSPQMLIGNLVIALKNAKAKYGKWDIAWGELNRYQRLASGKFDDNQPSMPAGSVASLYGQLPSFVSKTQNTKKLYGYSGNSFVAAVEFGPKIKAKSISTGGSSFDPRSPNFTDQAQGYLDGKFKDVWFYKQDLMKHMQRIYHP